jgi:hypothetical protein
VATMGRGVPPALASVCTALFRMPRGPSAR